MRGAGTGLLCIDFFHPPWCSCLQQGRYQSCAERGVSTQSAFESDTKGARQEASLPQILLPLSLHKRRRNHTQHHTQDAWTTTWWSILAGVPGRRSLKGCGLLASGAANKGGPHDVPPQHSFPPTPLNCSLPLHTRPQAFASLDARHSSVQAFRSLITCLAGALFAPCPYDAAIIIASILNTLLLKSSIIGGAPYDTRA